MPKSNKIYLDNAAATKMDPKVMGVISSIFKNNFANSGAIHDLGIENKKILEKSRSDIASILNSHSDEIVFTSGATESNNLAIMGVVKKFAEVSFENHTYFSAEKLLCSARQPAQCFSKDTQQIFSQIPHIVTTNIEHASVLETCKYLEKNKLAEVTYVGVEENGIVDPKKIKKALKENTVFVSVMYANNEIGTIQPIVEIAKEIRHFNKLNSKKIIFHTDATQAVNYLLIKVEQLGVDLLSFNGGKIYGPKGIGALFVKRKTPISKIIFGGEQEFGLRAGTENLAGIVGLAEALKITEKIKEKESARLIKLRDYFIEQLLKLNKEIKINGDRDMRLPNNINITIPKIPSDLLVLEFSARGIYISEKSSCKSGDKADSYVIRAIRNSKICKKEGSLRFSLGRENTKTDIDCTLKTLVQVLNKLEKWYN